MIETLDNCEKLSFQPEHYSSMVLLAALGNLSVMATGSDADRVKEIITRIEYRLKLREGQGEL